MSDTKRQEIAELQQQFERDLRQCQLVVLELQAKVDAMEDKACSDSAMVPLYVPVPNNVYQRLRERAEELGMPVMELASLWLWRATRELDQ